MISPHPIQTSVDEYLSPEELHCCERCHRQIAAAEREARAFVMAVRTLFGDAEAYCAAEDWIELAEDSAAPLVEGYPDWRHITIAAAVRLAAKRVESREYAA